MMNTTPRVMTMIGTAVVVMLVAGPDAALGQTLAARIASAPDGVVRFTFPARPGVCGDGENISVRRVDESGVILSDNGISYTVSGKGRHSMYACVEGPVELELTRTDGRITRARTRVGGTPRTGGTDLGEYSAREATEFLLSEGVLVNAEQKAADHMILAATLGAAETWPALLEIARAQNLSNELRRTAIFWVAQAAGDRATEGLQSIARSDDESLELRRQAVFALSQIRSEAAVDALIEIARSSPDREIRQNAIFWLGQTGNPRALAFFEQVLRG